MNDPTHDRLAISGATRSYNAGNISASKEASIKAEARSKLGSGPKPPSSHAQFQNMDHGDRFDQSPTRGTGKINGY